DASGRFCSHPASRKRHYGSEGISPSLGGNRTMAPRAARRGAGVLVVLLVGGVLIVTLLIVAAARAPQVRAGACRAFRPLVAVDRFVPVCGGQSQAKLELGAAREATRRLAYREALGHSRAAAAAAPDLPAAHVARGELAEMLGEYDEALAAFQRAAAIAPSVDASRRIGAIADRLGQVDLAVQTLDAAQGPWGEHAAAGTRCRSMKKPRRCSRCSPSPSAPTARSAPRSASPTTAARGSHA